MSLRLQKKSRHIKVTVTVPGEDVDITLIVKVKSYEGLWDSKIMSIGIDLENHRGRYLVVLGW